MAKTNRFEEVENGVLAYEDIRKRRRLFIRAVLLHITKSTRKMRTYTTAPDQRPSMPGTRHQLVTDSLC